MNTCALVKWETFFGKNAKLPFSYINLLTRGILRSIPLRAGLKSTIGSWETTAISSTHSCNSAASSGKRGRFIDLSLIGGLLKQTAASGTTLGPPFTLRSRLGFWSRFSRSNFVALQLELAGRTLLDVTTYRSGKITGPLIRRKVNPTAPF